MNVRPSVRRRTLRCAGIGVVVTIALVPSAALAADGGAPTLRATIGSDGKVSSVKQYTPDGAASAFGGQMPIAMKITHTALGAAQTFTYHVENTFSQTQTIHYDDTAGNALHTSVQLQLPLVAQLGIDVPRSMGALDAGNAAVTETPDGTRHVLWNLVLFAPLGSAVQDVTFKTAAAGTPIAELRATAVDPANTAGLSAASQNATANFQQDDFWAGYASGANGGLTLIKNGLGQLLAGVQDGADGAQKLADGSATAFAGSKKLSGGIGQIYAGQGDLTKGLFKIHKGLNKTSAGLTGGLRKIHRGQGDLTAGMAEVAAGLSHPIHAGGPTDPGGLAEGLAQIAAGLSHPIHAGGPSDPGGLTEGLNQIAAGLSHPINAGGPADPGGLVQGLGLIAAGLSHPKLAGGPSDPGGLTEGLGDAIAGVQLVIDGISQPGNLIDGTNLLIGGVAAVKAGLGSLKTGIQLNAGCAVDILTKVVNGAAAGADLCATGGVLPALPGLAPDPVSNAVLGGLIAQFTAVSNGTDVTLNTAFAQLNGGLDLISGGLSSGDLSNPGIKEGLQLAAGGLGQLKTGLTAAQAGSQALANGAAAALGGAQALAAGSAAAASGSQLLAAGSSAALNGSVQLADGSILLLDGSQRLFDGSGLALAGSRKLFVGTGQALAGSQKLTAGSGAALAGSKDLSSGVGQIADGNAQVAAGLPDAVDGIGQLIDGVGQAQDSAVGPLQQQLEQASANGHKQLAVLTGAAALASQGPGGAGASYVLTQSSRGYSLTAASSAAGGGGHTGRNVGIGVGGALLLILGAGSGFAMGRSRRGVAV
ncbi:MAG: putative rane protein [Frankiaceae bacterium]|nr:putative rane protein [Frankiaceae bacterium]